MESSCLLDGGNRPQKADVQLLGCTNHIIIQTLTSPQCKHCTGVDPTVKPTSEHDTPLLHFKTTSSENLDTYGGERRSANCRCEDCRSSKPRPDVQAYVSKATCKLLNKNCKTNFIYASEGIRTFIPEISIQVTVTSNK